jgi:uncharacterized protein YecE (DUF72 family)
VKRTTYARRDVRVGISGYVYPGWRGRFYPERLASRRWLEFAARMFDSIELNGTFYSLKSPAIYQRWSGEVPAGFVFAVKGSRFITHNLKLRNVDSALGNFFASGVLALGRKTGPFLWQLPPQLGYDRERMAAFLARLPRTSGEAEEVARLHDERVRDPLLTSAARLRYRHAFEPRHPSFFCQSFYDLLGEHGCALVIADTAGRFPYAEELTASFVYVRLHGSTQLYVSGYSDAELDDWALKIKRWRRTRDVYVYFDNDAKVHAPFDALRIARRLGKKPPTGTDVPRYTVFPTPRTIPSTRRWGSR